MTTLDPASASATVPIPAGNPFRPVGYFALFALLLALCFGGPLYGLMRLASHSELYSHIFLIPVITVYLIWIRRAEVPALLAPAPNSAGVAPLASWSFKWVGLPSIGGAALLATYAVLRWRGWQPERDDYLAFTILALVCFLFAGAAALLGARFVKAMAFPIGMLLFLVPFPTVVSEGIAIFFQHASADAAAAFFSLTTTPVLREGLLFHLPGMSIRVAEECSGIRSSLVLFITGLLASYLFLRSPWKRGALALFVIPLGIIRNGFRIFTIGMLCVHIDPSMIHSPIHHRGGPIFFALSLIPFFVTLVWLRKSEKPRLGAAAPAP